MQPPAGLRGHGNREAAGRKNAPFDQKFYLILNVAVGGNWGGKEGIDTTIWPQRMEVDYVRVYQSPTEQKVQQELEAKLTASQTQQAERK